MQKHTSVVAPTKLTTITVFTLFASCVLLIFVTLCMMCQRAFCLHKKLSNLTKESCIGWGVRFVQNDPIVGCIHKIRFVAQLQMSVVKRTTMKL